MGEMKESSKTLTDALNASDDIKLFLLISMQQTMQNLTEKIWLHVHPRFHHQ